METLSYAARKGRGRGGRRRRRHRSSRELQISQSWAAGPGTLGCCPLRRVLLRTVLHCLPSRPEDRGPLPTGVHPLPQPRGAPAGTGPGAHPSKEAPLSWPGEDLTVGPQICLPRGISEPVQWGGSASASLICCAFQQSQGVTDRQIQTHIVLNLRLIIDNISKEVISLILICF